MIVRELQLIGLSVSHEPAPDQEWGLDSRSDRNLPVVMSDVGCANRGVTLIICHCVLRSRQVGFCHGRVSPHSQRDLFTSCLNGAIQYLVREK